jgi:uncharacterized membrane protein YvbJ
MVKQCESCGEITFEESVVFCKNCGSKFNETELEVLRAIQIILKENQKKTDKTSKIQIKISFATLIMAMIAFIIAIGAVLISVFSSPLEQRIVGLGIIVIVLIPCYFLVRNYAIPINWDEIEE